MYNKTENYGALVHEQYFPKRHFLDTFHCAFNTILQRAHYVTKRKLTWFII